MELKQIKDQYDAVVVVEGKDDTKQLQNFFPGIETVETNGSAVSAETLTLLQKLAQKRPIIIFTDPDFNGERIRKIVSQAVPSAKQAFITRAEGAPHKKGSLGVEHASKAALTRALHDLHQVEPEKSDLTWDAYVNLGLTGRAASKNLREAVGEELGIGYGNGKQLFKRLKMFGISLADLQRAVQQHE